MLVRTSQDTPRKRIAHQPSTNYWRHTFQSSPVAVSFAPIISDFKFRCKFVKHSCV